MADRFSRRRTWVLVFLSNALVAGLAFLAARWPAPGGVQIVPPPTVAPTPAPTASPVRVHVAGAVASPGVYTLPPASIVQDALLAAGGPSADADTDSLNLAAPLIDGQQLYVSRVGQAAPPSPSWTPAPTPSGPININLASAEELETLPGIGPTYARRIVEFREQNGPFRTLDALMLVSGIGPATLEKIRPHVTVE